LSKIQLESQMLENELLRLDENSFSQSCKKGHFRFITIFAFGVLIAEFQNPKQDLSAFCVKMLISGRSGGPNAIKPKSGHWKIQRGDLSAALISTLPSHCFLIQVYSNKFSFNHFSPIFWAPVPFSKSPKHSTCFSFASRFSAYLCFFYSMTFVILANSEFVLFLRFQESSHF
jgi:hypothetical protein